MKLFLLYNISTPNIQITLTFLFFLLVFRFTPFLFVFVVVLVFVVFLFLVVFLFRGVLVFRFLVVFLFLYFLGVLRLAVVFFFTAGALVVEDVDGAGVGDGGVSSSSTSSSCAHTEDIIQVVISYEIYETSLRQIS